LDAETDQWGIKVDSVEIKHLDLPQEMQRAMARQAEAERERRSKVISAEGEYQASTRLAEAASIMGRQPMSLQLRFLQTLADVATENNSTIIFPVPIDLLRPLLELEDRARQDGGNGADGDTPQAPSIPPAPPIPPADGGDAPPPDAQ
ncbi:MAG: SPFH domain-containing protein, partial [Candidatus Tectomicrobia bacterium]